MLLFKILGIVLALLFGLVLLLFLAAIPRAGIRLHGKDGKLDLWLRYGWGTLHIYPMPGRSKAKKAAEAPVKEPSAPPKPSRFDFSGIDPGDAVCLALDILYELRCALRIHTLRVDVLIATGDAARTGMLLGASSALLGMIFPFLEQNFDIRDRRIAIDGDFTGKTTHWELELSFSARPVRLLWALIRHRHALWRLYNSILAAPEQTAAENQTEANAS